MIDYNIINAAIDDGVEAEREKSFDLGIPWVYSDTTGMYIIEEYKNGAKKIYKKFNDELKLTKIQPGKEGLS